MLELKTKISEFAKDLKDKLIENIEKWEKDFLNEIDKASCPVEFMVSEVKPFSKIANEVTVK